MKVISDLSALDEALTENLAVPVYLTIGVFDGIHVGHRELIHFVVDGARNSNGTAIVFTFQEHPLRLLAPPHAPPRITAPRRRRELFEELGVDLLIEIPFTRKFANIEAHDFVSDYLVEKLKISHITCGSHFRFGKDGAGDTKLLGDLGGEKFGFETHPYDELRVQGVMASSTEVRDHIMHGRVDVAARLLKRPFELEGMVQQGDKRGRTIGFPTANLHVDPPQLLPARGVYACRARVLGEENQRWGAMVNIGVRPTFDGTRETIEAHLFDFEGDLYSKMIALEFVEYLRGEQKFDGIDAIVAQLQQDEIKARDVLSNS